MDRPARLPIDCPRCENRGVFALGDDRTIACPLCNSWCTLCLEGVPTFVQITRPYRGSLIAGMRPSADGEILFEGYACDYHKATLKSYSSIAPPMTRCLAERFAADEAVSGDWRMKEWLLSCAIGQRRLAWPLSHHARCGAPLFLRERDAGADLATIQKMVGHESVTTTVGYDRRGDATRHKAADLVHVPFFPRQA